MHSLPRAPAPFFDRLEEWGQVCQQKNGVKKNGVRSANTSILNLIL
jgi:hypothetical protein